jgi:hypothetical protein
MCTESQKISISLCHCLSRPMLEFVLGSRPLATNLHPYNLVSFESTAISGLELHRSNPQQLRNPAHSLRKGISPFSLLGNVEHFLPPNTVQLKGVKLGSILTRSVISASARHF